MLDLKTDRQNQELLIQKWTWLRRFKSSTNKKLIEAELERFEKVLIWPKHNMMVIADIHLDKAETFLQSGLWLPPGAHNGIARSRKLKCQVGLVDH